MLHAGSHLFRARHVQYAMFNDKWDFTHLLMEHTISRSFVFTSHRQAATGLVLLHKGFATQKEGGYSVS